MKRGTIFLILFIIVAAGVIGASQFLRSQPALTVTLVVDPLIADWAKDAIKQFNDSKPLVSGTRRVEVKVAVVSDLDIWRDKKTQTTPYAWLPSSSLSVTYAKDNSLPFTVVQPALARTLLVWGGYASYVTAVTKNGASPLDWPVVQTAAKTEAWADLGGAEDWGFVRLGFDPPQTRMSGVAMLLSGAATFNKAADLSTQSLATTELYDWLQPIAFRRDTTSGDGIDKIARGASTVQIALLPETQWLINLSKLPAGDPLHLSYPAYQFVFDFPLALWDDAQTTADYRAAVQALGNWLATPAQQTSLLNYGLRPASTEPTQEAALFQAAAANGIQLTPTIGQSLVPPSRSEAQGLIQWFENQR